MPAAELVRTSRPPIGVCRCTFSASPFLCSLTEHPEIANNKTLTDIAVMERRRAHAPARSKRRVFGPACGLKFSRFFRSIHSPPAEKRFHTVIKIRSGNRGSSRGGAGRRIFLLTLLHSSHYI